MHSKTTWVHLIWPTYNLRPILTEPIKETLFAHIKTYAAKQKIHLEIIGGHLEHIHCLVRLTSTQSVAWAAKMLKGESAYWANQTQLIEGGLYWANEYLSFSVSPSEVEAVRSHILQQDLIHADHSFTAETAQLQIP